MSGEQWYTNKELFEQIIQLRDEMRETRAMIRQYNGLREEVGKVREQVEILQAKSDGRYSVLNAIRLWGGWLFALITLLMLIYKSF